MEKFIFTVLALLIIPVLLMPGCRGEKIRYSDMATADIPGGASQQDTTDTYEIVKTEGEWKKILTTDEYNILREKGTERPFVNEYWDNSEKGIYYCAACGQPLYSSRTKFKSGTGWPSFWEPLQNERVEEKIDTSFGMTRTEIICSRCGSHLGHLFKDGPEPTGLRYCMNSAALHFVKKDLSGTDKQEYTPIDIHEDE